MVWWLRRRRNRTAPANQIEESDRPRLPSDRETLSAAIELTRERGASDNLKSALIRTAHRIGATDLIPDDPNWAALQ